MVQYSEKQLIEGIKNRDNMVLRFINDEYYPSIKYLIFSNHGNDEEARDIFHDAVIIVFDKVRNGELTLNCSLKTYIYAICKNLWLKRLKIRKRRQFQRIENPDSIAEEAFEIKEKYDIEEIKRLLYQRHFVKLNEMCQEILGMVLDKKSFREIAKTMKFRNEQYARKKKYRCLQILIDSIMNDPDYKNFIEDE